MQHSTAPTILVKLWTKFWFPAAIVFFYIYNFPYFAAINSANELPRIYLTMAIVDRGSFDIGPEMNRFSGTPDTASYNGKLFSNKAPGMSFLTVPTYLIQKLANGWKTPDLLRMFFWFRLFGAILPSLLFLLLFWRFLSQIIPDQSMRRMILAAYALGTMALTYGTLFIAHQLSSILLATSFITIFLYARGWGKSRIPAWAGLAAGAGVLVDYQVAFIGPPLFLYLLWAVIARSRSKFPIIEAAALPSSKDQGQEEHGPFIRRLLPPSISFCLGAMIPLGILLFYHWQCFGSPFKTGYNYVTNPVFHQWHSQGFLGLSHIQPAALWGRYFSADDGLFYYSPFLLLAFPGLVMMFRNRSLRAEGIFCASIIAFFIYFSTAIVFVSGWDVGPRYITCALPYYSIATAIFAATVGRTSLGRGLVYGLMTFSIIIYLLVNAVFPHYPESFSNPWFDVTWRFSRAGYLPYNLGWLLGGKGVITLLPYLFVAVVFLIALHLGSLKSWSKRIGVTITSLALASAIGFFYYGQLHYRSAPVPVGTLMWMHKIWEPRHPGLNPNKLIPAGDLRTAGLKTME